MRILWHSSAPMFSESARTRLPPYKPNLDAIGWIEDPDHGPSRPRTWRCLWACPHKQDPATQNRQETP